MIGQKQRKIYKISTERLKLANWDIEINYDRAVLMNEVVSLFDSQMFRLIEQIVCKPLSDDSLNYVCAVVISKKSDFVRATNSKGIKINGLTYRKFVGTTGGLKNNTLLFVNVDIWDELTIRCECGRDKSIKLVPAKYEAYKALTASASIEIINPDKILVVSDCITHFVANIIQIDDTNENFDIPQIKLINNVSLENTVSDGFNLCTIEYMQKVANSLRLNYVPSGVCLRNAWLKGMMYPFPIKEFVKKYHGGSYIVKDIWGNDCNIMDVDLILTESSLKLYKAYKSIDDYLQNCKKFGYNFSVTKYSPEYLEDIRTLNYQYLQSYELCDTDVSMLCDPTLKWIKNSFCGEYQSTLDFLGIDENTKSKDWAQALFLDKRFLNDPYVVDHVKKFIKKKIDDAKIGKLLCNANYQLASGDPFALMQHICGVPITGLLKAHECYSKYWADKKVTDIVAFRSPMTSHNNIRKVIVKNNENVAYWYQYMSTIFIINSWDTFCMAENGADWDGDTIYTTNNSVLLKNYRQLPAVQCIQKTADKVKISNQNVLESNKNAFGNKVGTITNRATSMIDILAQFNKNSKEYEELSYRILTCQNYQQNEIDHVKGIKSRPMNKYWYEFDSCVDDFNKKIVANRKPYFFIYRYPNVKREFEQWRQKNEDKCLNQFKMTLTELEELKHKTEEQKSFYKYYQDKINITDTNSTMNKICHYIEKEIDNHKVMLKSHNFDYSFLKTNRRCYAEHKEKISQLYNIYMQKIYDFSQKAQYQDFDTEEATSDKELLKSYFRKQCQDICRDNDELLNIVLDLCYSNKRSKQFCWDVVGDLIIERLKEIKKDDNI